MVDSLREKKKTLPPSPSREVTCALLSIPTLHTVSWLFPEAEKDGFREAPGFCILEGFGRWSSGAGYVHTRPTF